MFSSLSNIDSAKARASSVLPTPVGPRKINEPMGRFGSFSPARARMTASATACTASSWPITRSCKIESSRSSFSQARLQARKSRDGHSGPASDNLRDLIGGDLFMHETGRTLAVLHRFGDGFLGVLEFLFFLRQQTVAKLGGAGKIIGPLRLLDFIADMLEFLAQFGLSPRWPPFHFAIAPWSLVAAIRLDIGDFLFEIDQSLLRGGVFFFFQRLAFDGQLGDAPFEGFQFLRHALVFSAKLGGGFIHQIDGFIGEEAVRNITMGEDGGGDQGCILNPDTVVDLILFAQAAQKIEMVSSTLGSSTCTG